MMLGVDWLEKYSPSQIDFKKLKPSFKCNGSEVNLNGAEVEH